MASFVAGRIGSAIGSSAFKSSTDRCDGHGSKGPCCFGGPDTKRNLPACDSHRERFPAKIPSEHTIPGSRRLR